MLLLALTIISTAAAVVSALGAFGWLPQRHRPVPQPIHVLFRVESIEAALMIEPRLEVLIEDQDPPDDDELPEVS